MNLRTLRPILAASLLLAPVLAAAAPSPIAIHPGEAREPAPGAEAELPADSAAFLEAMDLLVCVNALAAGELAEGEKACSDAIALNDKDPMAYKLRGYGYLLERRYERAIEDFRISLRLRPADAETLAGYAEGLSGQGNFVQAVEQFSKAIRLAPQQAAYWSARCWAQAGSGKHLDRALADCNHALLLSPGAAEALNGRGFVRLRMRQFDLAIGDYSQSLVASRAQPSAWFGRGLARLALGQMQAALSDIATARKGDPDIDTLFVTMGAIPPDCTGHPDKTGCPPPVPPKDTQHAGTMVSARLYGERDFLSGIEEASLNQLRHQITPLLRHAAR